MDRDKAAMIRTVIVSVCIPFVYCFVFFYGEHILPLQVCLLCLLLNWFLYAFAVIGNKKKDIYYDADKKRVKWSIIIQLVIDMAVIFAPMAYELNQPLERGHRAGIEFIILLLVPAMPFFNHLFGKMIHLLFIEVPFELYEKFKGTQKESNE